MNPAQLIVVGTPIGNLGDWSPRAQQALGSVGLIACEDTRRTGLLLSRHGIENPGLVVMNEHTERHAIEQILARLDEGVSVAVVTDAGMPSISDPGAGAVEAAADAGVEVVVVPGPTAVSAALAVSGFGGGRYVFEGFLPRKGKERRHVLNQLATEPRMVVLYEAPHRITRSLADLAEVFGAERRCVVARELTKMHEDVWRGNLGDAVVGVGEPRGEYVIVVDHAPPAADPTDEDLVAALAEAVASGLSKKDAAAEVAGRFGVARNRTKALTTQL